MLFPELCLIHLTLQYWAKGETKALYEFNKCLLHPPSIWQLTFTFLFPLLNYQCKVTGKQNLIRGPCSKWFGKRSSNQLSMILIWQLHCESHALFQIILILTLPWLNKLNTAFGHVPNIKDEQWYLPCTRFLFLLIIDFLFLLPTPGHHSMLGVKVLIKWLNLPLLISLSFGDKWFNMVSEPNVLSSNLDFVI
jgi:hypothetical protein